jgi:hypothetical protein
MEWGLQAVLQCSRSIELIGKGIFSSIVSGIAKGQNFPLLTFCLLLLRQRGDCDERFNHCILLSKWSKVTLQQGIVSPAGMAKEI